MTINNRNFIADLNNKSITILAKPRSKKTEVLGFDENREAWKVAIKAVPEDGKANAELLKYLYKEYKLRFEIVSGFTSKEKVLKRI